MVILEKFSEEDFDRLISWIKTEEELIQFAGSIFAFPITREQLIAYSTSDIRKPFKVRLISSNDIIGHCELNFQNPIPRLSRILIADPAFRNRGLGKEIVKSMLDIIFNNTEFKQVDLSVFDWNKNAISSYEKVGFKINDEIETYMTVNGNNWRAINMIIEKDYFNLLKA